MLLLEGNLVRTYVFGLGGAICCLHFGLVSKREWT